MGVSAQGAPEFTIGGDPSGIATRAAVMMDRANEFAEIHSSLSALNSDGWKGRAADRFREKFKIQLQGWVDAQETFSSVSKEYSSYASTLQSAQSQCDEIRSRWEQGRRAVEQAQNNKADARSRAQAEGGIPMIDASCDEGPGRATMQGAEEDFQALVNEVNEAGNQLNSALDEGISKLPERTWGDAAWRTAGSILLGVYEGVEALGKLMMLGLPDLCRDLGRLWREEITPAEFQAKYLDIPLDTLSTIALGISTSPGKFFEELFYSVTDWDTWSDDPGRAFGRMVPDIAITIATAGAAASAKGLTGTARAAFIGRELFLQTTHIGDGVDIARASKNLLTKLSKAGSHALDSLAGLGKHHPHSGSSPSTHSPGTTHSPADSSSVPSSPSYSPPNYPGYNSGGTPDLSGMPAPSHGNGGYSGNPSHGGAGAVDPNSRFAPPGQQSNGMSGAAHSGDAGTTDPTSKYAPPTHQQNGTSGAAQAGSTPQASGAGTSGAATPAAGSHGTSGTASTGAGTAAPPAGAHGNPSGPAHNGMAGEGVSAADGLPPRRNIDTDEPRNGSSNDLHSSAHNGESYDAGNRKDSNHLNVDSHDFDKSSNGQYSPANNTGTPQQGGVGTDGLVGAGVGRSEASVGAQGSYEHAGAFGGSDPSRVSHGADSFGGTADFGANAGHGGHGANGVTNSADTSGGLGSTPSGSHSTGPFTGHGGGHTGADSGTHGGSSTPAQGSYPAAGNTHAPSHAGTGSGAGHGGNHQAGQGANGHSGVSSSHDSPTTGGGTPKSEPPIPAPPKSEATSTHSLSDATQAPHTGANNAAGMPHADHGFGSTHKADTPDTAMDQADMPTREIDGNAVRRRAGAAAGNSGDFSWENNIVNKSGKADDAGLPQHASDPTVGADAPHATHTGADGATDTSHAGHGDGASHTADGNTHAADPTTPTHEADGSADGSTGNKYKDKYGSAEPDDSGQTTNPDGDLKKNPFYDLLSGNESSHAHHSTPDTPHAPHSAADGAEDLSHAGHGDAASHTADGNTHAADPNTHTHEADGPADVSTGDKDKYGSAESDGAAHPTTSDDDLKNKSLYDILSDLESSHAHHSTPDAPHAPHAGADGATDMSHAGHGDGPSPTADGKPHAADPTTHTHEADGSADGATGNKYKDEYGNPSDSGNQSSTPDVPNGHAPADGVTDPHRKPAHPGDGSTHATDPDAAPTKADEATDTQPINEHEESVGDPNTDDAADVTHADARGPVISDEDWRNLPIPPPLAQERYLTEWANKVCEMHPEIPRDGLLATYNYTTPAYSSYNGPSRDLSLDMSDTVRKDIDDIESLLDVAPNHNGTVYRGGHVPPSVLQEMRETGVFRDKAFLSSSVDERVALDFASKNPQNSDDVKVLFTINSKKGTNIQPVSQVRFEQEVLFHRNTPFKVKSVEYDPEFRGYRVELSDMD